MYCRADNAVHVRTRLLADARRDVSRVAGTTQEAAARDRADRRATRRLLLSELGRYTWRTALFGALFAVYAFEDDRAQKSGATPGLGIGALIVAVGALIHFVVKSLGAATDAQARRDDSGVPSRVGVAGPIAFWVLFLLLDRLLRARRLRCRRPHVPGTGRASPRSHSKEAIMRGSGETSDGRKLAGKVVVLTGASAGVGRAIACELGAQGAKVALLARGREGLEATQRDVEAAGGQAIPIPTDVAYAYQVEAAADRAERELGPIDVWINDAMVTVLSPVSEMNPEEYEQVTRVTYLGTVYGTQAALRRMRTRDAGHIIQVGSALAYRSIPLQSAYCAAKHAIRGFTDSLRSELIHDKSHILLTMVQLPGMNTPQFEWCRTRLDKHPQPVPPIFQPEVAARAIVSVIGTKRREMLVGMSTVYTVLGSKVVQGFLDWYLARKAYSGQQADRPLDVDRKDNLFRPVEEDLGAHGSFDDRSRKKSAETWLSMHRPVLGPWRSFALRHQG